jgi:hypothetical protein
VSKYEIWYGDHPFFIPQYRLLTTVDTADQSGFEDLFNLAHNIPYWVTIREVKGLSNEEKGAFFYPPMQFKTQDLPFSFENMIVSYSLDSPNSTKYKEIELGKTQANSGNFIIENLDRELKVWIKAKVQLESVLGAYGAESQVSEITTLNTPLNGYDIFVKTTGDYTIVEEGVMTEEYLVKNLIPDTEYTVKIQTKEFLSSPEAEKSSEQLFSTISAPEPPFVKSSFDKYINKFDTRIFIELGEYGDIQQDSESKDFVKNIRPQPTEQSTAVLYENKVRIVKPNQENYLPLIKKPEEQYIKYKKTDFRKISPKKLLNPISFKFEHFLEVSLPDVLYEDIISVYLNSRRVEMVNVELSSGKLSIKENKGLMLDSNNVSVITNENETLIPQTYNYETDLMQKSDILDLDDLDVEDFEVEYNSFDIKTLTAYDNVGKDIYQDSYYRITFSENESEECIYDIVIQNKDSKFKIMRLKKVDEDYVLEEYSDCVLEDDPSYSEDKTINKWNYSFICFNLKTTKVESPACI